DTGPDRVPRSYRKRPQCEREEKDTRQAGSSGKQPWYQPRKPCRPLHAERKSDFEKAGGGQHYPCHVRKSVHASSALRPDVVGCAHGRISMREMLGTSSLAGGSGNRTKRNSQSVERAHQANGIGEVSELLVVEFAGRGLIIGIGNAGIGHSRHGFRPRQRSAFALAED